MRSERLELGGLATYVWMPSEPPRAVLVTRTPYGAAGHAAEGQGWVHHGVALVAQDVRGRHESAGEFAPYAEMGCADGPVLVAWVRSRFGCPVVLWGTSYGAHAALATAAEVAVDGVAVAVPALGLGETARTRGGVLQLASRLGWWLANDVRRPWSEVVAAARTDAERAALAGRIDCPLLAIGGTDDYFAHDIVDLAGDWRGPTRLVLGPWDHSLHGARRAQRLLAWLDALLTGEPSTGTTTFDREGRPRKTSPAMARVVLDRPAATADEAWYASAIAQQPDGSWREVAHGASFTDQIDLGPLVLTDQERATLTCVVRDDDFPRYARSRRESARRPDHHLELIA